MEDQQLMEAEEEKLGEVTEPAQPEGESEEVENTEGKEEPTYDIDGEKYTLSQLKEWKAGNMKDADYRKKTTELANQRRQYEQEKEQLARYQETIDYINKDPELLEQVNALLNQHYQGTKSSPAIQRDEIPGWAKQQQQVLEDIQLERSLDKLKNSTEFKGRITDDNEKDLLRFAYDNKIGNLDVAAKAYFYSQDTAGAKLKGAEEVTAGLQKKAGVKQPISSGNGMTNPPKGDVRKMSMDQVFEDVVSKDLFK
jgi:hypothetical protein